MRNEELRSLKAISFRPIWPVFVGATRTDKCFVFGNLPYYITSPIIHHLLGFAASIRSMALLVQREVADRLTATPGSRAYGYLTVLTHLYSEPRLALAVPPGAFSPHPKVNSALVVFRMISSYPEKPMAGEHSLLHRGGRPSAIPRSGEVPGFVKRCFAHKRKNLVNNLTGTYAREDLKLTCSHGPAANHSRRTADPGAVHSVIHGSQLEAASRQGAVGAPSLCKHADPGIRRGLLLKFNRDDLSSVRVAHFMRRSVLACL